MDKKIDPFDIREGRMYMTRGGMIVGPIRLAIEPGDLSVAHFAFDASKDVRYYWDTNGVYCASMVGRQHNFDLVEQIGSSLFPGTNDRIPPGFFQMPEPLTLEDDPAARVFPQFTQAGTVSAATGGMTLRQYYAGQFMAALIGSTSKDNLKKIVDLSVSCADELIAHEKETS